MDWFKAIEGVRDPEVKANLREGYKQHLESEKIGQKARADHANTPELIYQQALQMGMPDAWAKQYASATEGGKTEILKAWHKEQSRNVPYEDVGEEEIPRPEGEITELGEQPQPKPKKNQRLLTPTEDFQLREQRYKSQLPIYQDAVKDSKAADSESIRVGQLVNLNKTGTLPKGFERLNVDWQTGDIRVPALASPEAQLFTKTVADFLTTAKDTFGSRVTNFDIEQFKKRLPSLANTEEGREIILEQMQIINDLNKSNAQAVVEGFDKAGGVRNVDYDRLYKGINAKQKQGQEKAKKELAMLTKRAVKFDKNEVAKYKKSVPQGHTLMLTPEGQFVNVPNENVSKAEAQGKYEKL
jgi:hypothetical protein